MHLFLEESFIDLAAIVESLLTIFSNVVTIVAQCGYNSESTYFVKK